MKCSTLISFLLLALPVTLSAQTQMGFGAQFSRPLGNLKAADYRQGGGVWMEFLSVERPTRLPLGLQWGFQWDYSENGSHEERIEVQYPTPAMGNLEIFNESMGFTGLVRLISPEAPLRLYLDGRLGTRLMMSNESIEVDDHGAFDEEGCEITSITKTWTFAYGASAGTQIRLSPSMRLDLRATYTQGSGADFVDLNSVRPLEKAQMTYNLKRSSNTGMWLLQAGINMTFRCDNETGCCRAPRKQPRREQQDFSDVTPGY